MALLQVCLEKKKNSFSLGRGNFQPEPLPHSLTQATRPVRWLGRNGATTHNNQFLSFLHSGDGMVGTDKASFSTHDQDNDGCGLHDCAEGHKGGWWYKPQSNWCVNCYTDNSLCEYFRTGPGCNTLCTSSNLNGNYNGDNGRGIYWMFRSFCKLNSVEMKILPSSG